jgi:hypothetical protein
MDYQPALKPQNHAKEVIKKCDVGVALKDYNRQSEQPLDSERMSSHTSSPA